MHKQIKPGPYAQSASSKNKNYMHQSIITKQQNYQKRLQKDFQLLTQQMINQLQKDEEQSMNIRQQQTFVQHTQSQQKIWRLFKSLDCQSCGLMFNNRERKPSIICANNHLLCKSCYSKIRQSSFLCPFCGIRMSTKNTCTHQSIQMFLKIYNEIFQKQKSIVQQKRKKSYLDFQIPKNIKTICLLLFLITSPWIFYVIKYVTSFVIDIQGKSIGYLYAEVSDIVEVTKIMVEDAFYINLYTNQQKRYIYYGDGVIAKILEEDLIQHYPKNIARNTSDTINLYTPIHRANIQITTKTLNIVSYFWTKVLKIGDVILSILGMVNYCIHFILIIIGIIQIPFLVPVILLRVQSYICNNKYRYRLLIYLQILQSQELTQYGYYLQSQQIQKLTKFELYFCLIVRNYIHIVLSMYKNVQVDMKKRCEELEYKKQMRLLKKNQKQYVVGGGYYNKSGGKYVNKEGGNQGKMKFTF